MSDVLDYLVRRGLPFLVLPDPSATTADDAARDHRLGIDELVRTEVMRGRRGLALMVVPATGYLDLRLARRALDDPTAEAATPDEIRALAPSCDPGAVPPLSKWLRALMYVDVGVADREQLIFPAGRPNVLVCLQREELFRDAPYVVTPLVRDAGSDVAVAPSHRAILSDEEHPPAHLTERLPGDLEEERRPTGGSPSPPSGDDVA